MDRLHAMSVFVAVVDCGGFAAAARKLGISPPAVTRAISDLEARLGVRLLSRTTRTVRVTDAGASYVEDCRRVLSAADEADEAACGTHAAPRGLITVTAPAIFGNTHVAPIVTEFLRLYPQASAACWFVDRVVNLADEGVDVAIRIGALPDSTLKAVRVGQVRRVICASPIYLEGHPEPVEAADLQQHVIISANPVTPMPEWRLRGKSGLQTVRLSPRMSTSTNEAALSAAVAGFGITRVLSYQVADHLRSGALQAILREFESDVMPVHVVHREGRHASQKVRAFLDLTIERLRENPAVN